MYVVRCLINWTMVYSISISTLTLAAVPRPPCNHGYRWMHPLVYSISILIQSVMDLHEYSRYSSPNMKLPRTIVSLHCP